MNDVVNPNPFIMPNRLTGAPYLALGNYAVYAYLIYLTHVPYIILNTTPNLDEQFQPLAHSYSRLHIAYNDGLS